jgi:hypothetical protein
VAEHEPLRLAELLAALGAGVGVGAALEENG